MKIQSLSIVVPTKNHCVNKCAFCVSRTHTNPYEDKINSVVKNLQEVESTIKDINAKFLGVEKINMDHFINDNNLHVIMVVMLLF